MIIKTGTLEPIVPTGTDWNIEFDCRTKTLKNVSLPLIVSGENNSTILLIKTPLYYNSVDLTTVNCIVKYKTSWTKEDGSINEGQVDLTNTATKFDDYIIYTWALDQRQTRLPGKCDFSLKFFMNLSEDPYQNQTRYYLQKISNENGESLQIGKDEMVTDIEQKYWSIASLPSSIDISDGGSIAEGVEPDDSNGYDEGYEQGYEEGKQAEYSEFWDNYQQNGERTDYRYGFAYWKNGCFSPKYDIKPSGDARWMFYHCEEENIKARFEENNVVLDTSNITNFLQMFENIKSTHLPTIDLTKATSTTYMFNNAKVQVIDKLIFSENTHIDTGNATFAVCNDLTTLTIEGTIATSIKFNYSRLLDSESVQSIIDHLKDLTGGTAQTLTVHQDVRNKLTTEQLNQIASKNWLISPENATA